MFLKKPLSKMSMPPSVANKGKASLPYGHYNTQSAWVQQPLWLLSTEKCRKMSNKEQRKNRTVALFKNVTVYVFSFHISGTKFKPRWATSHPDCPSWPNIQVSPVCFLRTRKDTAWWCGHKLFREETSLSTFQLWRKAGFYLRATESK